MVSGTVKSESGFEPALDAELYVHNLYTDVEVEEKDVLRTT